jgi:hypothetical protein
MEVVVRQLSPAILEVHYGVVVRLWAMLSICGAVAIDVIGW